MVGSDWHWENDWDFVNSGKCGFWGVDDDCCYDPSKSCPREHPNGVGVGKCDKDNRFKTELYINFIFIIKRLTNHKVDLIFIQIILL